MLRVISDIHGRLAEFEQLLATTPDVPLIILGDSIGYGPESVAVAKMVLRLVAEGAVCLRGNWEDMLVLSTRGETPQLRSQAVRTIVSRGGRQMLNDFWAGKPTLFRFLDLIEEMPLWHYQDGYLTSHAGADLRKYRPGMTAAEFAAAQSLDDLVWGYGFEFYSPESVRMSEAAGFTLVAGHVPVTKLHAGEGPFRQGNIVGVDFGASSRRGRLGIVMLPGGEFSALAVT